MDVSVRDLFNEELAVRVWGLLAMSGYQELS